MGCLVLITFNGYFACKKEIWDYFRHGSSLAQGNWCAVKQKIEPLIPIWKEQEQEQEHSPDYISPQPVQFAYIIRSHTG